MQNLRAMEDTKNLRINSMMIGVCMYISGQHTLIKWTEDKSNSVAGELFTLAHI